MLQKLVHTNTSVEPNHPGAQTGEEKRPLCRGDMPRAISHSAPRAEWLLPGVAGKLLAAGDMPDLIGMI